MGRIYKRGNIWYLDVWVKGRRVRRRVGKSKKIAELALKDTEVKIARDEFGFSTKDISIERLLERFLEYSQTNHRPSTTKRYKAVSDHFRAYLSSKCSNVISLSQLSSEVMENYKTYRRSSWVNPNGRAVESESEVTEYTRKGARAHTINIELDSLKAILNVAIRWGYIKENPMRFVKPLRVEDAKPIRFLTVKECEMFLEATPSNLYPIYFTFLNTGMRKAELENLQWGDVDFKSRKIHIRRKKDWQPKTGERTIPIGDALLQVLSKAKKEDRNTSSADYVFKVKNSGYSHNRLRNELIKIAEKAGIENLTKLHTLRHTFASQLVMQGVDLPTVRRLMGHSDIKTTMVYAHLAPDHLSDAINKLPFK